MYRFNKKLCFFFTIFCMLYHPLYAFPFYLSCLPFCNPLPIPPYFISMLSCITLVDFNLLSVLNRFPFLYFSCVVFVPHFQSGIFPLHLLCFPLSVFHMNSIPFTDLLPKHTISYQLSLLTLLRYFLAILFLYHTSKLLQSFNSKRLLAIWTPWLNIYLSFPA